MNDKKILLEIKKILYENYEKKPHKNIKEISDELEIEKTKILNIITSCKDIKIIFNEDNYDSVLGPYVCLKK